MMSIVTCINIIRTIVLRVVVVVVGSFLEEDGEGERWAFLILFLLLPIAFQLGE